MRFFDHGPAPCRPASPTSARATGGRCGPACGRSPSPSPTGPSFEVDGNAVDLGALVPADRLRRPRGPRAAPGRLRRRRTDAVGAAPGVDLRDGRAVRRSAPDALLDQLLRRGRVRPRPAGQLADAGLRLPGRDPLLRRRAGRQHGRAVRPAQRRVRPRGGRRRDVEARRPLQRHQRDPPRPAPRHLLLDRHRQLRLRLLLVPLPGRHDRARRQAHRHRVRRGHR